MPQASATRRVWQAGFPESEIARRSFQNPEVANKNRTDKLALPPRQSDNRNGAEIGAFRLK